MSISTARQGSRWEASGTRLSVPFNDGGHDGGHLETDDCLYNRKGCGQEFDPDNNASDSCTYHSGNPIFHEGLKSWSCCSNVNKPVLHFDDFMKIPGCARGEHTDEPPNVPLALKPSSRPNLKMTESSGGKEVYSTRPVASTTPQGTSPPMSSTPAAPPVEEEDDLDTPVKPGAACKRKGCGAIFVSDEVNRKGDGPGTVCTYHPSPPIFHEGSKGYHCCKRRVLEFDEFLKIEGCKKGRHLFTPKVTAPVSEEMITSRIDYYQTLTEVHVSIFAKQADKERSVVKFEQTQVSIDLFLPGLKRFCRTLNLFGPIDVQASSFQVLGTKVEVHLRKLDNRSWNLLEKTTQNMGNFSFTFGVGGRTGTVGGKELVLDQSNNARST